MFGVGGQRDLDGALRPRPAHPGAARRGSAPLRGDGPRPPPARRTRVGKLAREHLVQQRAQCVHVGAAVQLPVAGSLLRAHVGRRPHGESRIGERLAAPHGERDAEIRHQRVPRPEEDVLRLHVAVNHPFRVRKGQRLGSLPRDPDRLLDRQAPLAIHSLPQALTLHVGHGEPEQAVGAGAAVEHGEDVGMLQPGGEADLALEPLEAERGGEAGVKDLERDRTVVPEVVGQPDGGHPAPADGALQPVPAGQCLAQAFRLAQAGASGIRCGDGHEGSNQSPRPGRRHVRQGTELVSAHDVRSNPPDDAPVTSAGFQRRMNRSGFSRPAL